MKRGGPRRNRPSLLPMSLLPSARDTPNSYRAKQTGLVARYFTNVTVTFHVILLPAPVQSFR